MTRVFEDETFVQFYDDGGSEFSDLVFRRCKFISSAISITMDPRNRSTVRSVRLENCSVQGCALDCAIVEDVVVDGLKTSALHQSWGAVFKHVILRGKIGRLMFSPLISPLQDDPEAQRALDEANARYYEGVDWALDISEADAQELDLRGVPGSLIRRDPETQVLVTRKAAMTGEWRNLKQVMDCEFRVAIEFMLEDGRQDVVLAAPRRDRDFKQLMGAIEELRAAGIAEPD